MGDDQGQGAFTLVFQSGRPALTRDPAFVRSRRSTPPLTAVAPRSEEPKPGIDPCRRAASPTCRSRPRWSTRDAAEQDRRRCAGRSATARRDDLPVRLPGDQPRHPADLQRRPRPGRVDRDPDRAARDGLHVRDARRDRRPVRVRGGDDPLDAGAVWIFAHFMDMAIYVTNIVTLIGLAIAIDYSMLVVFRYREELRARDDVHEALRRRRWRPPAGRRSSPAPTSRSASRCSCSCRCRSCARWGVGGLLVPLVSIAASATFLPALLAVMGTKVNRLRVIPKRMLEHRRRARDGLLGAGWRRSIMRRPVLYLVGAGGLMLALALPGDAARRSPAATTAACPLTRESDARSAAARAARSARARSRRTRS